MYLNLYWIINSYLYILGYRVNKVFPFSQLRDYIIFGQYNYIKFFQHLYGIFGPDEEGLGKPTSDGHTEHTGHTETVGAAGRLAAENSEGTWRIFGTRAIFVPTVNWYSYKLWHCVCPNCSLHTLCYILHTRTNEDTRFWTNDCERINGKLNPSGFFWN